ncbi:S41 family peptidase [Candidatus Roseilinea sp. NK_OTU-006]|uniref:S41 family peptidase n=1 Tax=Candidatus Roseilinea sp. NK_OTU-006 TaxID=2704250 RepID=UPI00145D7A08|nr:S41 family peptidase [Candidatus Roseilinea sp. NK_OTU-006]
MSRVNRWLVGVGVVTLLTLTACVGSPSLGSLFNRRVTPAAPADVSPKVAAQLRDFDFVAQSLREAYLNADALDDKWQMTVDAERLKIAQGDGDEARLVESLQKIIEALDDEEVIILPPAQSQPPSGGSGTYSGIGVLIDLPREGKDRLLVLAVYPDSPADRAGIKPHDAIIAIEGEPVTFAKRAELIPKLRGEAGSKVTITVRTPGQPPRDLTLTRRPVEPRSPIRYKRLPDTNIGYIAPNPTQLSTMRADTANALRELSADRNIDGLVLDLRIIRGNEFPLDEMLSLFANGPVGAVQTRSKKETIEIIGKSIAGSQEVPMAVLVSELTSGQAEAFAGLLQDLGRAQIVGTKTSGQVAQFATATLPSSRLRVQFPTADYISVKNNSWRGRGVTPNILSAAAWEDFTAEDDPHVQQAIHVLTAP